MRITNVSPNDRYFSYAGSAGRMLKRGETSSELAFQVIFDPSLIADLAANRVRLKVDPKDQDLINFIVTEDLKKVEPAPAIVKAVAKAKPKKVVKLTPRPVTELAINAIDAPVKTIFVAPGSAKSISDLKQHNRSIVQKGTPDFGPPPTNTKADVATFMGSRV